MVRIPGHPQKGGGMEVLACPLAFNAGTFGLFNIFVFLILIKKEPCKMAHVRIFLVAGETQQRESL
jgi:hypothetical protein